jgi:hypothetical protein
MWGAVSLIPVEKIKVGCWHKQPRSYARRSMFEKGITFSADLDPACFVK